MSSIRQIVASSLSAPIVTGAGGSSARVRRLPSSVAFYLQASIIMIFLAASSAPSPLYGLYQADWGFSPITITVIFGVYALAVLGALLTVGRLSDYIGRRPVLLGALVLQGAAMIVFVMADGVTPLMVARIIQGFSTGLAAGAVGAGLLDIDKKRGTVANGVGPISGTALGSLGSGLLVQYLPWPMHLVYLTVLGILVIQTVGVLLMAETVSVRSGALSSLKPVLRLPASARQALILMTPMLVAVWSLAGFYGALGPSLVHVLIGHNSYVLGGLSLFILAGSASVTVFLVRAVPSARVMSFGIVAVLVGQVVTLIGINEASILTFFIGGVISGSGFGAGFQGAVRLILPLAEPQQRAGVLSMVYVVCYLAMGLPAVIAGFRVVHSDVVTTGKEYAVAVIVLVAIAALGQIAIQVRSRARAIA